MGIVYGHKYKEHICSSFAVDQDKCNAHSMLLSDVVSHACIDDSPKISDDSDVAH